MKTLKKLSLAAAASLMLFGFSSCATTGSCCGKGGNCCKTAPTCCGEGGECCKGGGHKN